MTSRESTTGKKIETVVVLGVAKALTEESIPSFRAKQWHHVGGRYGHMMAYEGFQNARSLFQSYGI